MSPKDRYVSRTGRFVGSYLWQDPDSPTGMCIYDHHEDSMHDHCIFCGDPEERK